MKDDVAIRVSGLSKKYEIGKQKDGSLRGSLASIFRSSAKAKDEFWALKDVNFEVKKGEVIGIIGKNGAGKSTLLKVLSQITKPSSGKIEINGRVASLLEVGTGFHPELTGRENVYLNGTILGMTRKEVAAKFDEIVAFSGVEKFIDTPVKHYSSGMYVRLAFAVAAHLEPEILIIDEVLAVGDAEFQKKCLGKMKDVAGEGRTVLFVSHNMAAVRELCDSVMLIDKGRTEAVTYKVGEAINRYIFPAEPGLDFDSKFIKNITFLDAIGLNIMTEKDVFKLQLNWIESKVYELKSVQLSINKLGVGTVSFFTLEISESMIKSKKSILELTDKVRLAEGKYSININLLNDDGQSVEYLGSVFVFDCIAENSLSKNVSILNIESEWR